MTRNRHVALGDSKTEGFGMGPVAGIEPLPRAAAAFVTERTVAALTRELRHA